MQDIDIEAINHDSIDQIITINQHPSITTKELYHKYIDAVMAEFDIDGNAIPEFDQVIIYEQKNPTKRLSQDVRIEELSNNNVKLVVIFPTDGNPILDCEIAGERYFIFDYNKNDKLLILVRDIIKMHKIIIENQITRISINADKIDYAVGKNEPLRKFLEGNMNSTINIVIQAPTKMISPEKIKAQSAGKMQEGHQKVQIPDNLNKQESKKEHSKPAPVPPRNQTKPAPKEEIKPSPPKIIRQPEVKPLLKEEEFGEKPQHLVAKNPDEKAIRPMLVEKEEKEKNFLQLILHFEAINGQGGRMTVTREVDRARSMQQLLPELIMLLKSNGFDWGSADYKHDVDRDKLNITNESAQFKKLDKPLRQLVQDSQKSLDLTIERHYEGGKAQ